MKSIHTASALIFLCAMFSGCSTHFYKVEGDGVALYLKNPDAVTTTFRCSLDGYTAHKLEKERGAWVMNLPTEKPFRYFYVVDGELFIPQTYRDIWPC